MNILDLCNNGDVLSIIRIVKIAVKIIKIAVPIILIVTIMIDFMKCIKPGSEVELSKTFKSSANKFLAAALIFLVPTFVNLVISIAGMNGNELAECINNASSDKIKYSYEVKALELLKEAEDNNSWNYYYSAVNAVNKIKDETTREEYSNRLAAVKEILDSKTKSLSDYKPKEGTYIGSYYGSGSTTTGPVRYDAATNTFYRPSQRGDSKGTGAYGLQQEFSRRLTNLITECAQKGRTVTISNGYRSTNYQRYLYNCLSNVSHRCNRNWVACPGSSNHNFGLAADLGGDVSCAAELASKYNLTFPMSHENWHIEPINIVGSFGACEEACTNGYYNGTACQNVPSSSYLN